MKRVRITTTPVASLRPQAHGLRSLLGVEKKAATKFFSFVLSVAIVLPTLGVTPVAASENKREESKTATVKNETPDSMTAAATTTTTTTAPQTPSAGKTVAPKRRPVMTFAPVNVRQAAQQESLAPATAEGPAEIRAIDAPRERPETRLGVPIAPNTVGAQSDPLSVGDASAPPASSTGSSPGPNRSFNGEFLSSTNIPPDTMGAVGTNHVMTVSNGHIRIQTREGVQLTRMTLNAFWAGITLEGGATPSTFDPKIIFDRFNSRYVFISSANAQSPSSAVLFAVSQTADPTGTWFRYAVDIDPAATTASGRWVDYPSIGFNKNWIVVMYNDFFYGAAPAPQGFAGQSVFVLNKPAAYAGSLSSYTLFQENASACAEVTDLACGFTMAPTITEDNTTETAYLVEDWDNTAGQLRLSKITGTAAAPVLTVGTQFPQSPNSWRYNAPRISGTSGGYAPQRQQQAHLPSGTRLMTNDSRIQNAVLRGGTLWTTHTVMLAATPTAAGTAVGNTTIPDVRSGIQWWAINPTIENSATSTAPLQRGRIEDLTADNCHNGASNLRTTDPACDTTAEQRGQFFAYPSISVNKNNDVLIGYTQFSALTYPSAAYSIRLSADPANTMRDPVVYRPGQANYNLGSGSGTARQNRWGDYSAAQTDPINDTEFWTLQEYAGTVRDFGIGLAGNWEMWWARVSPTATAPSRSGNLIISEFRLRGPQGVRDEFVELYNPSTTPVLVNATDNTEGWAVAFSADGTAITSTFAVIPNGTVIPGRGYFLVANNPDGATGPLSTYSLNFNPSTISRNANSDTGYSLDLADNGGIAIFKTSNAANFTAATRMDSVGFTTIAAGLFKEGAGIPAVAATTPTGQISFVRDLTSGTPNDTGANENDFRFVDPVPEILGTTPQLGAAGPQNLNSPIRTTGVATVLIPGVRESVVDPTPTTLGPSGTLTIQRRYTNRTGAPVTRLRFRIIDITTLNSPDVRAQYNSTNTRQAILRALNGANATFSVDGRPFQALRLEVPPTQDDGGGLNSTLVVGTLATPQIIPVGGSVDVQYRIAIQQGGYYRFFTSTEADR